MSSDKLLVPYNKNGISVLLPKWLRVTPRKATDFLAERKWPHTSFLIEIGSDPSVAAAHERNWKAVLPSDDHRKVRELRIANVCLPYEGKERVVEDHVKPTTFSDTYEPFFLWELCLYPTPKTFIHASVYSAGRFNDEERLWSKVIHSLRVDPNVIAAIPVNAAPATKKNLVLTTENNLFGIGTKKFEFIGTPFSDDRDEAQGFSASPKCVFIAIPVGYSVNGKVEVRFGKSVPDISKAIQAFAVPISFDEADEPYALEVAGPALPIVVPPGKYDMVVRLFECNKDDEESPDWRAVLTFLPAGTVGAKVFKLMGRAAPKEVFIRGK